ncbi:similar to Saccharomyces cerevisiae YKL178C STE3 Receptor for a factor pheromone, couples to MAP kinase cascade to mediate pheromone response [Maudiozyma saulgeensis]|uniref:Similar to Saccharomyces cerevisiae YKL178C STE3 Receptor for a factor pheromone, couples to MAP kinase cascade to mediate pheromone response n=1 Tax=Maudiozyma saulgeensis TaxID=1789683 RepID=A0A1X7R6Q8_9SACH|nr:similar to Saccharomyces cerevisiae YKL178C STE3 Receptor for a factor pheromone, couples to MAP kinase cascade to mediate pheromone response [Kazachstania saulgeensis]
MSYKTTIIGLCSLALISLLPPLAWHSHSRNIPAIILITWLIIMNITCIVNAAVWSDLDFMNRWDGKGWCDIVIKLQVGANIGISCAVTNITYNLHQILKAENVLLQSNSIKKICIDLLISLLTPIAVMGFSYLLQVFRYGIARYNGCQNLLSPTWITTVLYTMWMLIWSLIGTVYACLVLYVFYKKRKDVRDILHCTNSGLNLTRFARLLTFCFIIILVMFPFSIFTFVQDLKQVSGTYDFKSTHSESFWNVIIKFDPGKPVYGIWLYVLMSYVVFFIFGLGTDALNMYSRLLRFVGLGSVLDFFNKHIQKRKTDRVGKLLKKLTGKNTEQSDDIYKTEGYVQGFDGAMTTPVSENYVTVDYKLGKSDNWKNGYSGRFNPFDDDEEPTSSSFDKDLEVGNKSFMPYVTKEYNFMDDISLEDLSSLNKYTTTDGSTYGEKMSFSTYERSAKSEE